MLPSYKTGTDEWNHEVACLSGIDTDAKHLAAVNFTASVAVHPNSAEVLKSQNV